MATLIACADGNLTAAATWAVVDSTSLQTAGVLNTNLTASYVTSSTFTPGAITIDGIAIKFYVKSAGWPGTISVALDQGGSTVSGTEVTLNPGDIDSYTTPVDSVGWYLFKFSAVTLSAATAYSVKIKTSNTGSNPAICTSATNNGNWARMLRTTDVTHTPAAGDAMYVIGEHTGAGTGTSFTVIMDSEATTDYTSISVGKRGTLTWGTTASKVYVLVCSGSVYVWSGGTWNQGTTGTPMPSTSTGFLKLDCVADGDYGFIAQAGSTVNIQGASKTYDRALVATDVGGYCNTTNVAHSIVTKLQGLTFTGWPTGAGEIVINGTGYEVLSVDSATQITLNANCGALTSVSYVHKAASEVTLVTDVSTAWASGDSIGIASTSRTYTDCQKTTLNGAASGTTLTLTDAMTRAHIGTSPTQAEVINLTRNVGICSNSSTLMAYVVFETTATVDVDWAEFYYLGENATDKLGIVIKTTTGSCNINRCSVHDCEDRGIDVSGSAHNNWTFSNGVIYNCSNTLDGNSFTVVATTGTNWTITGTILMLSAANVNTIGFNINDVGGTFTYNTAIGCRAAGIAINEAAVVVTGTFSNLTSHSNNSHGLYLFGVALGTFSTITCWRNGDGQSRAGIYFGSSSSRSAVKVTFTDVTLFGNAPYGILADASVVVTINNLVVGGDSVFGSTHGLLVGSGYFARFTINNSTFSVVSGIKTAHTTADIGSNTIGALLEILLNNCLLSATTEVANQSTMLPSSYIRSLKHDQTAGTQKEWQPYGTLSLDSSGASFYDVSPSVRGTPNNASNKLEIPVATVNLNSGQKATVTVKVRESVAGDGTDYNGSRMRLRVRANVAAGIAADATLTAAPTSTATAASEGAFETLTGVMPDAVTDDGVMEFYVDCDGTTGWVNVDTASVTVA